MQATKPKSKQNKVSPSTNVDTGPSKSIAQRVMEMATVEATTVDTNNEATTVDDIANKTQKIDLSSAGLPSSSSSDFKHNDQKSISTQFLLDHPQLTASNSSSKAGSSNSFASNGGPMIVSSESIIGQIMTSSVAKSIQTSTYENYPLDGPQEQAKPITTCTKATRTGSHEGSGISLDTKVPYPTNYPYKQEEVSYYNDHAASLTALEQKSIKNHLRVGHEKSKTQSRTSLAQDVNKDHQNLTIIVPQLNTSSRSQRQQASSSTDRSPRDGYANGLVEDDYDTRYDNALVEAEDRESAEREALEQQQQSSVPSSPKAKSAPATPCNVTPIAFHQNTSHIMNPSPANTLPPDIRKNFSSTCRVLPSSMGISQCSRDGQAMAVSEGQLDELRKRGEALFQSDDNVGAVQVLSRCIELAKKCGALSHSTKKNFYLAFGLCAEARFKLGDFAGTIEDSQAARELNPKWTQAYYLQGQAQLQLLKFIDALPVFAFGLAQEPGHKRLFESIIEAALKSTVRQEFEAKYEKLKSFNLDKKPYIVVSVIGQELIAMGHMAHATVVLESALKIADSSNGANGIANKKFRGSILSTISYAYFKMQDYDKAVSYMQKELDVENELEDVDGQCRVLANLGYTYYRMRKFDKSYESHRQQMSLAIRTNLFKQASMALNAIGHVHSARADHTSALQSHTACLELLKQLGDNTFVQFRELLCIGHVHSMMADYKSASEKYNEAIRLIKQQQDTTIADEQRTIGLIMVHFNLAYLDMKRHYFSGAKQHHIKVMELAKCLQDPNKRLLYEMRAWNGLGHAHRLFKHYDDVKHCFERQLYLMEQISQPNANDMSQALCNLGMVYQHFRDNDKAWDLFDKNLCLVDKMSDPMLRAYAQSYMASMYFLRNKYKDAETLYKRALGTFKDLDYCTSERKTIELNMAAVQERLG